jgi:nucleotide-binding universal stress UspA family protein
MGGASDGHDRAPRTDRLAMRPGGTPDCSAAVVVGLDGSETSWDAFWWACWEARRLCGRVIAVFVSSCTDAGMAAMATAAVGVSICDYAAMDLSATEQARWLLAEVRRNAAEGGPEVFFVHARGDPARELLRIALEAGADLIVVGQSTKARHHIAGSLGRYLIARRRAPVVAVVP